MPFQIQPMKPKGEKAKMVRREKTNIKNSMILRPIYPKRLLFLGARKREKRLPWDTRGGPPELVRRTPHSVAFGFKDTVLPEKHRALG